MDTLEIRPIRKLLIPFVGILTLGLFFMNYVAFLTDYYKARHVFWKILTLALSASLIATIYKLYRQIRTNAPFIIMSGDHFIYIKKGTPVSYPWSDIDSWTVSAEDSTTYLIINARGSSDKIGINLLDKTPDQIDDLIRQFKENTCS